MQADREECLGPSQRSRGGEVGDDALHPLALVKNAVLHLAPILDQVTVGVRFVALFHSHANRG